MRVKLCLAGTAVTAALLLFATAAPAATVVAFVAVRSGETLVVSNPQSSTISGSIRLVPDAGTVPASPLAFSLPAQGTKPFANVLASFGSVGSPALLAVESSDTVSVSGAPLRVAYPDRPVTLPVRFDSSAPATGSLVIGILNGSVRINIYEHATSVSPLATRTFNATDEQVTRINYSSLLPAGLNIGDGYATVTPLSGQSVGISVNAPVRRHAVGTGATSPPVLSITGSPACEFATGIHASVPPITGATYRWTLVNATAMGTLTSNAIDMALGSKGYASFGVESLANGTATTAEAAIQVGARPVYNSSSATSVTLGQDATISWTLAGGEPTSQTLTGTDLAAVNLAASDRSYIYHPTTAGPKSYDLSAANGCGGAATSGTYSVSANCTSPHIDSFANNGPVCAGGSAQLTWSTSGSGTVTINNGIGSVADSGSIAVSPSVTTAYTITKTASCGSDSAMTTVTNNPSPTAPTITAAGSTCANSTGNAATIANPGAGITIVWNVTNGTITGGQGTTSLAYTAGASGNTQLGVSITNASGCSATSAPTVVTLNPGVSGSLAANPTTLHGGEQSILSLTVANGTSWTISSALGNSLSQTFGSGSGSFNVTYSADFAPGNDIVTLTINGACSGPIIRTTKINVCASATVTAPSSVCANSSGNTASVVDAGAGAQYSWNITGGMLTAGTGTRNVTFTANGSGSVGLNVTVSFVGGCSAPGSATIPIKALPSTPTITPSGPTTFCAGGSVTLTSSAGTSYLWSPGGATTPSLNVTASGSYTVTVTNASGCSTTSAATVVTVNPLPVAVSVSASPNNFSTPGPTTITFICNNCTSVNITTAPAGIYGTPTQINATTWQMSWSDTAGPATYTIHAKGINSCGTSPEVTNTFDETF